MAQPTVTTATTQPLSTDAWVVSNIWSSGERAVVILTCGSSAQTVTTAPSGWTQSLAPDSNGSAWLTVYYRDIDGTEADFFTWTMGLSRFGVAHLYRIADADTSVAPQVETADISSSTSFGAPDFSPQLAEGDYLLIAGAGTTGAASQSWTADGDYTEGTDEDSSGQFGTGYRGVTSPGATAYTATWTAATSDNGIAFHIAIVGAGVSGTATLSGGGSLASTGEKHGEGTATLSGGGSLAGEGGVQPAVYRSLVEWFEPVAWWRLGEASGTTAFDEIADHNGTYVNTPTLGATGLLTGDPDTAVDLTAASTQYISVPDAPGLDVGDTFTLLAWISRDRIATEERIFSKGAGGFDLLIAPSNQVALASQQSAGTLVASTVSLSAIDTTYMVAATKDGADVHLYINGADATGTVTNATIVNTATALSIGRRSTGASYFDGTIDEAAIWNRALTAAEIAALYAARDNQIESGTASLSGGGSLTAAGDIVHWRTFIDGTDRTDYVKPFSAFNVVSKAFEGSGVATIPLIIDDDAFTPATEEIVQVVHKGTTIFEGPVRQVAHGDIRNAAGPRKYVLSCQDYTTLLDDDVIETAFRSATESDKSRVAWLVSTFGSKGVTAGAEVQQTLAFMPEGEDGRPEQDFGGQTLREAIEQVTAITGASYYVDFDKKLHYFLTESEAAAFDVSDDPDGVNTFKFSDFTLTDDSVDLVHRVLVIGQGDVSVFREIATLPAAALIREAVVKDSAVTTTAQANEVGDAFLARHSTRERKGSFTVYRPGLLAGHTIQVTHAGFGLSAESFHISSVTAKTLGANEMEYTVEIGDPAHDVATQLGGRGGVYNAIKGAQGQAEVTQAQLRELQAAGANLVRDSSFEASTDDNWTVGSWTHGHEPADPFRGSKTARLALSAAIALPLVPAAKIAVDRTDDYWFSAWSLLSAYTSGTARIAVREYDSSDVLLATTAIAEVTAVESDWTRHKARFGPSNAQGRFAFDASTASVEIAFDSGGSTGTFTWDVDGVQVERGNVLTAFAPAPEELYNVAGEVVIDENGITIVNGALVVKNPGGTTIIDGSSDIFRIAATGTTTLAGPDASGGHAQTSTSVTVNTGFTYTPMHHAIMQFGTNTAHAMPFVIGTSASGGNLQQIWRSLADIVLTSQTRIQFVADAWDINLSGGTRNLRYYILEQDAI